MRKQDIYILAAALAGALTLGLYLFLASSVPTGSWGLSFRQEGTAPIGNASASQLESYDAAYIGNTGKRHDFVTVFQKHPFHCLRFKLVAFTAQRVKSCFHIKSSFMEVLFIFIV